MCAQVELNEDGTEVELGKGAFGVVVKGTYRCKPALALTPHACRSNTMRATLPPALGMQQRLHRSTMHLPRVLCCIMRRSGCHDPLRMHR